MATIEVHGRPVAYDELGPATASLPERLDHGSGLPLLILHGFIGGREDFAGVLEELARDRRVVVPDLPGHGGSAGSARAADYALAPVASWVSAFADALGLSACHLLGYSLGGLIAQRVAAAESQRLRSLILMDTGLGALREEAAERVLRIALAARDRGPEAALAESRRGQPVAEDPEAMAARFRRLHPAAVVGHARNLLTAVPLQAFLRGIDVPVLVVHGEDDLAWTFAEQRLLAATVAGAEHVCIPGAAHAPQQENPEAWLASIRGFLRRAEA